MRTVVVTGASRGIGRHVAERLVARGDRVLGLSRSPAPGPFESLACDVTDPASVERAFRELRHDRSLYALVNAAGAASMNLFLATPTETMQRVVATNLLGTMHCSQQAARILVRNGGGRIVSFSSIAVALGLAGEVVYAASKAGVEAFTRAFAREMAPHGVLVNAIAPGPVDTAMLEGVGEQRVREVVERQIVRRQAEVDDVWNAVELLLSERSAMIAGAVLHVGGV